MRLGSIAHVEKSFIKSTDCKFILSQFSVDYVIDNAAQKKKVTSIFYRQTDLNTINLIDRLMYSQKDC